MYRERSFVDPIRLEKSDLLCFIVLLLTIWISTFLICKLPSYMLPTILELLTAKKIRVTEKKRVAAELTI